MKAFAPNQREIHSTYHTHFAYFKICIAREKLEVSVHYIQFYIKMCITEISSSGNMLYIISVNTKLSAKKLDSYKRFLIYLKFKLPAILFSYLSKDKWTYFKKWK